MHAFEKDIYSFIHQIITEHGVSCLLAAYFIADKYDTRGDECAEVESTGSCGLSTGRNWSRQLGKFPGKCGSLSSDLKMDVYVV